MWRSDDEVSASGEKSPDDATAAVERRDVERRDVEHSDVEHSDVEHRDVEHRDVEHSDVEHSDVEHSDVEHSDVEHSDVERELFEALAADGFRGDSWDQFEDGLARHGIVVIDAWVGSGKIYFEARRKGMPLSPTDGERLLARQEERDYLVNGAVAAAVRKFRADARAGTGWRHDGGVSLASYFVAGCVSAFVDEFRRWRRADPDTVPIPEDAEAQFERFGYGCADDVAGRIVDRDALRRQLGKLTQRDRNIVWGKSSGYSDAEIAELFDEPSPKAVERRWARMRAKEPWIARLGRQL